MSQSLPQLSDKLLATLPEAVRRPAYDRSAVTLGIVHLGIGAFHRAHQAVYTDDRLASDELDWGISGMSLRSPAVRDALQSQDGLYTVLERGPEGDRARVIGSVREVLTVPDDPQAALGRLSGPNIRIITLTVTEKAYCQDAASGTLDETNPDIADDLKGDRPPRTVPGLLVQALRRRRDSVAGSCTVLVCDNLPSNGETVARIISRFAAICDPGLCDYIANETAFPCSMVDRIVPATCDEDRAAVAALGYHDSWPVVAEPFSQWVIEDRFVRGRPRWEEAGAQIVKDVRPFELMKLRALNGAHSALAYLGAVSGLETVADAVADPVLAGFLRRLWDEDLLPTIPAVPGMDLGAYTARLGQRFRNPAIRHRLRQIAMDGSQKLPQRLLAPARDRLRDGAIPERIAVVIAAWMRFLLGHDEQGRNYTVNDPMAGRLVRLAQVCDQDPTGFADTLLAMPEIFDAEVATHPGFKARVVGALRSILARGVRGTLAEEVSGAVASPVSSSL